MNMRQTLILAAALLLGCLIVGAFLGRPSAAEPKAEGNAVGRYQIVHTAGENIVVLDTATGHCWNNETVNPREWGDIGSPAK